MNQSIQSAFDALKAKRQIALMPFVAGGFPDRQTSAEILPAIEKAGATLIEVGVPFSDPIADGPTIQEAFNIALGKGLKVSQVFETVAGVKSRVSIPLVSMVSYSIVFRYGPERYFKDAKAAGFSGIILPDLPLPEGEKTCDQVRSAGLDTVLLVAPTTSPKRRELIAKLSSGFIYYLSVAGITGERDKLPADLEANVRQLKQMTDRPVCVGFGISKPEHLKQLEHVADGAIVGSAVVKKAAQNASLGPAKCAEAVGSYCRELLTQVR
jgi:tryptophan synthase alpha chain